jgi:hypothetical protein
MRITAISALIISLVCSYTSALTITGTYSTSSNLTSLVQNISIPTVLFNLCQSKNPYSSSQAAWVIPLDTDVNILSALDDPSNLLPSKIPDAVSGGLPQFLLSDFSKQDPVPAYYNELLPDLQSAGFDGLIVVLPQGDITYASWAAVRYWAEDLCPIPLFFSMPASSTGENKFILTNASSAILDFEANTEQAFAKSAGYIIGVTIPGIVISIGLIVLSAWKMYVNGFPKTFNTGSVLCIISILSAIFLCKLISLSKPFN